VKFLIDAQLPPALARFLKEAGYEAEHLIDKGLENSDDSPVWDYAVSTAAVIVTKDEDFAARIQMYPEGPAVVWLRIGNCSNRALLQWLAPMLPNILNSLQQGEKLIEII
jgi:predicted nuclease of predicted toxin-antitoxin system